MRQNQVIAIDATIGKGRAVRQLEMIKLGEGRSWFLSEQPDDRVVTLIGFLRLNTNAAVSDLDDADRGVKRPSLDWMTCHNNGSATRFDYSGHKGIPNRGSHPIAPQSRRRHPHGDDSPHQSQSS